MPESIIFIISQVNEKIGADYMESVIEAQGLTKDYGELRAVSGVSFSVPKGVVFGLLGQNGSGKTTIIKMLTGQVKITEGDCSILGVSPTTDPVRVRSLIGIIPEQETPPSFLTSIEYLQFAGKIRGIGDIGEKADWWFDFLDFADKKDVLCKDLSRGTRQKLMFAQAFLDNPEVAVVDEPLINLDPVMQRKVKDFLKSYTKEGRTVFISTHILENAQEICDKIAVLHKGVLLYTGNVAELNEQGKKLDDLFLELVSRA